MWSEGENVQATIYKGPYFIIADGLKTHIEKSIELKLHIPFPGGDLAGKYVIPTSVEIATLPDYGDYQVVMKGVIKENANEE